MPIAEGVAARVTYKEYATGDISSNTEPDPATDPGPTDGQVLRRTEADFNLAKDTYQSQEIRTDRQIVDFRHGTRRVPGTLSGEMSPGSYFDLINATHRATAAPALSLGDTEFTSVASDEPTSKFTLAAGDPVTEGLRIGDIIRFSDLATAANNNKNFLITGFGGTSNREITVDPAPATDASPDTAFTLARPGKTTAPPSTGLVSRKFAFEVFHEDLDIARLFTECRMGGYRMGLPAQGMSTLQLSALGRNEVGFSGAGAPFFTAPTASTATGICAAVNGVLRLGGSKVGVVTGLELTMTLSPDSGPVVGQAFVPEIFLGRVNLTGNLTAYLENASLLDVFRNETEPEILVQVNASGAANTEAITVYLPRIKAGGANVPLRGESGQVISMPIQALKYVGAGPGIDQTTIRIHDTAAA